MLLDKHELLISGKKIFGGVRWAGGVSMVGGATKGRRVMDTQRGKEPAGLSLGFCSCSARSGNSRLRLPHTHTHRDPSLRRSSSKSKAVDKPVVMRVDDAVLVQGNEDPMRAGGFNLKCLVRPMHQRR